eukprot:1357459-Pyramimonas_sp.AAC.1
MGRKSRRASDTTQSRKRRRKRGQKRTGRRARMAKNEANGKEDKDITDDKHRIGGPSVLKFLARRGCW